MGPHNKFQACSERVSRVDSFRNRAVCHLQFRVPSDLSGALSDFSSYGPAVDLSFKPDISAPGSLIVRRLPAESPAQSLSASACVLVMQPNPL